MPGVCPPNARYREPGTINAALWRRPSSPPLAPTFARLREWRKSARTMLANTNLPSR
jgi:hypothetical protein